LSYFAAILLGVIFVCMRGASKKSSGEFMKEPMITVSGLRGRIGAGLDASVATEYARAYGTYLGGGKVIVGRDSRPSGAMLAHAVMAGLASTGCDPIDIGLAATPTTGLLVRQLGASGGVEITASHNPADWNGIKLFHREGRVLTSSEGEQVKKLFESKRFTESRWDAIGKPSRHGDAHVGHLTRILSIVDAEAIRRRVYHIVLDSNHGVGGILGSRLLTALGCRVTALGGSPDGAFEHPPEPVPENLLNLSRAVRERQAHIGFAQDPDGDRLAIVDETGRTIGEENTIALVVDHVLRKTHGPVVVNLSTTRTVEEIAAVRKAKFERTPVGEANVVEQMMKRRAVIGGEGNGGVIHPQVVYVRDSFVAMALVLEAMALNDAPLSQLVRRLPQYQIIKQRMEVNPARLPAALRKLASKYKKAKRNDEDGLRLDFGDRWVHVRPSNTEPIARLIAEARTEADAKQLVAEVQKVLAIAGAPGSRSGKARMKKTAARKRSKTKR
jgi:phosphomannomutase